MSPTPAGTDAEPTVAERVRTVLEAASSLVVSSWASTTEIGRRPAYDADGSLVLDVPADAPLAVELLGAAWPGLAVTVEVTDVAPVALRDRVRARVTLTGTLGGALHRGHEPREGWATRFQPRDVSVEECGVTTVVEPEALAPAAPDPLARLEAEHLMHLDAHHPEVVPRLARAVLAPRTPVSTPGHHDGPGQDGPHPRSDAARVRPVRLDRYGLVLRVEDGPPSADVRVPFATPLVRADQLADATRALLAGLDGSGRGDPAGPAGSTSAGTSSVSTSSTCTRGPSATSGPPTPSRGPRGGHHSG